MAYSSNPTATGGALRPARRPGDRPGNAPGLLARAEFQPRKPMLSYEVSYLRSDGAVRTQRYPAPATPAFLAAFSAFARGTLITTTRGPVAVEDLSPGMKLVTNERGPSPLLWIGAMTLMPDARLFDPGVPVLTRIMADALGIGRPMADFIAGPSARLLQRSPGLTDQMLQPVRDLVDGMQVIGLTPPSPVVLYHLALYRHATITAAGLPVETYHPGPGFEAALPHQDVATFLGLFPHVRKPSDFGSLAHPRQPLRQAG
jgi:hypothetical protein